jgi:hypothetical protein
MADPATMMAVSMGLQVFGGIAQTNATTASLEYSAIVNEINASTVMKAAEKEEERFRREGRATISASEALAGGAGVTAETFAPALSEAEKNIELDALAIRQRGRNQARNLMNQAEIARAQIAPTELAGLLNIGAGAAQTALLFA